MAEYLTNTSELTAVADAIRTKGGTTAQLSYPVGFVSAISAIETGGGGGYTIDDIAERNMMSGSIYGSSASYIRSYAFYMCNSLTEASFPMVTSIGEQAFCSCSGLTTISFPMVTSIGTSAFSACSSLTAARFPSATSIDSNAFRSCIGLTTASFPAATSIGNAVFMGCSSLSIVNIPVATSIGSSVFRSCIKLLELCLNNTSIVPTLGINAFSNTPIGGYTASTGGVYGSVYVPASLYSSFLTATNWSSISARIVSV